MICCQDNLMTLTLIGLILSLFQGMENYLASGVNVRLVANSRSRTTLTPLRLCCQPG